MSYKLQLRGIYIIKNSINNEFYIGSTTVNFNARFKQHIKDLKANKHHSRLLQNAYNEYGKDSFSFNIFEIIDNKEECRERERLLISELIPTYNMTHRVSRLVIYDLEMSIKLSRGQGGKPFEAYHLGVFIGVFECQSQFAREYNLHQSKITGILRGRLNQSKGFKFKYVNEDFKYKKKKRVFVGPSHMLGKKHSEETKIKIGLKSINKKISPECKLLMSAIKKEKFKNGTLKLPDYNNRETAIKQARNCFNGLLKIYKDGVLIGEFLSTKEASEFLNIKSSSIAAVICGRRKSIFGYVIKKEKV